MIPDKNPFADSTDFISRYEGWSDIAYQKKGDKPTIGYGTTNPKWVKRGRITREEGRRAMMEDLAANEGLLRSNIVGYDKMPDSAKIVLRDILYNVGPGNLFRKSPNFIKALNEGNWQEAARHMDWDNNKPGFSGARKRNAARQQLFLSELGKRVVPRVALPTEGPQTEPFRYREILAPPTINTNYSIQNTPDMNRRSGILNAFFGAESPSYGGTTLRMPTIRENPENPIAAIGDFLTQGYTKLQDNPIIGPLIPF